VSREEVKKKLVGRADGETVDSEAVAKKVDDEKVGRGLGVGADKVDKGLGASGGADKVDNDGKTEGSVDKGPRNLAILTVGAILLAVVATSVSLYIYHASGDIYLDRSRPGYLPDEEEGEAEESGNSRYKFGETGEVDAEVLEEYLRELEEPVETIDEMGEAFGAEPLGDEALGIK